MNHLIRNLSLLALLVPGGLLPAQAPPPRGTAMPSPEAARFFDQAYAEMQKKAYAEALPLYEKALALAPDRAAIWNEYAICLRNLRRLPAAARAGWRAIQLDGGKSMQPWNAQANTLMEARDWPAAQRCLEQVEALHPDRPLVAKAWLNLVFRMLAAGERQGIVDLARRATRLDPTSSLAWIDLGQAQACTGADLKDSTASFEKGRVLAEQEKDAQRADYAGQLLKKVQAGESIWPAPSANRSWQTLPAALQTRPDTDASRLPLPAVVPHHFSLEDGGTLSLSVPETWVEAPGADRPENLFTTTFTVPGREGFKVFFSPIKGIGNPLGVKATAEDVAKRLLAGSAETELPLHELTSTTVKGYWVLSTDRRAIGKEPAKGDYRHLISFLLDVGGLQCVGTVLTNSKAPEVVDPCITVFNSAQKREPATKK